jgi:hypothetical protein
MPDPTRERHRDLLARAAPHCPTSLRSEIEAALAASGRQGRPLKHNRQRILQMHADGHSGTAIDQAMGLSDGYAARVIRESLANSSGG